jgi:hypothetical protein
MKVQRTPAERIRQKAAKFGSPEASATELYVVLATIEAERDNLSRAESLLRCLKIAMEYGTDADAVPYYPDVAQIAGDMVRKSINALDPINLPTPDDRVRENIFAKTVPMAMSCELPLSPLARYVAVPRKRLFHLHRRDYSESLRDRDASSSASASANTSG